MKIIGNPRPVIGIKNKYALLDDNNKPVPVLSWNLYLGTNKIVSNVTGEITFLSSGKTFRLFANVIKAGKKTSYAIAIITVGGVPKITELYWEDSYGRKIGDQPIGYLDQVKLVVKTENIPTGDTLSLTIFEDEYADGHGDSSRKMGTYKTNGVNIHGKAFVNFNNIKVYQNILNDKDYVNESVHEFYAEVKYLSKIDTIYNGIKLHIKNELKQFVTAPIANKPVVVGTNKLPSRDERKRKDFTFGIFIDGTLNNKYNSKARVDWENDQIKKRRQSEKDKEPFLIDPKEHLTVAASSQSQIGKKEKSRYKFAYESSYENDLSNPAIIFQNYIIDKENKVSPRFKIYSEGMGTNTVAGKEGEDEFGNLKIEEYKTDDIVSGTAFGQGNAGILDRVKRAIELMEEKIEIKANQTIGTLTIDVFGFSRGAAAARNFVYEITRAPEPPKMHHLQTGNMMGVGTSTTSYLTDHNGYEISDDYRTKALPKNGRLGYLLAKRGVTIDKLIIRFAGLYDTVPHHGLFQSNDIADLGLDAISQAQYTVHLVAGDEHRKNFSLVDISGIIGKKGGGIAERGVELYLPGVHCDVGGSYVEGRPEKNGRLLVNKIHSQHDLQAAKKWFVDQGWYDEQELEIHWDSPSRTFIGGVVVDIGKVLSGTRLQISNQYSYIPLHIMVDFCVKKGLIIDNSGLIQNYSFKNTAFSTIEFLNEIELKLKEYANGGKPLVIEEPKIHVEPDYVTSPENSYHARMEYERRKREGQELQNKIANKKNASVRRLRREYLHWNAVYGESLSNILAQPNEPNFEDGHRKRMIR